MLLISIHRVKVTEDGKKALIDLAQGDMRKVLNILQSAATAFPEVSEDSVYTCVGHPLKSDIMNILKWLLNDDFSTTFTSKLLSLTQSIYLYNNLDIFFLEIQEIKIQKGLALQDILTELHTFLYRCMYDLFNYHYTHKFYYMYCMSDVTVIIYGGSYALNVVGMVKNYFFYKVFYRYVPFLSINRYFFFFSKNPIIFS